uniref:Fibrinolytic enzyme n=1 Tax=Enchytraeus japonensis TaxID=228735 RepID=H1A7B8_9ANNE|nr:fibrinolytic enzyme [Enchytraeus japonensis]
MLPLLFLIATAGLIEARPSAMLKPSFGFSMMGVVGGTDASPGEFPWQLSQQRLGGSWSHSCGASLIGATRALSAAHCVDGASASILRVIAGLHQRSNTAGTQTSNVAAYTMHESYNQGSATFANDVAILNLATAITTGGNIAFATLAQGSNDFAGTTCVISGWGRTSASNALPDTLQKASIPVISGTQCQSLVAGIGTIWDGHICLYDSAGNIGSCNGDSGGPLNCPSGGSTVVAGVTSWGISSLGVCRQDYPSVYTRVSYYYTWINSHL